jgi:hypothetical protein
MRNLTSLLLGNGINRLKKPNASWQYVLSELANFSGHQEIMDGAKHIPLTLIYEQVVAAIDGMNLKRLERKIKKKVAEAVREFTANSYHKDFEKLGFKNILTTNYDYNLGADAKPANLRPESKYSVFRRRVGNNQSFWMMHGEAQKPDSIMLGYEHYAGALQKIRSYVTSPKKELDGNSSPFRAGNYDFDINGQVYSWVDVFLRDDMHILGYSLEYTEIEIWWLLAYRARLKRERSLKMGGIYYYLFSENPEDPKIQAKISLLKSLDVKVHLRKIINKDYQAQYDWALKHLSRLK